MDEYYEWIKDLLKEENIDLDVLKSTKNPEVLTHIHEAVRDLRDSLEIVRQDIGFVENEIYSKAKVNKCALHGEQLVISESSDGEKFNRNIVPSSSTTSTQERPINRLPKKIKERHISNKTKCLYLGAPYYLIEKDDETESADSSDLEELKNRCKLLREQYQKLSEKKEQKTQRKRIKTKRTSGSQTTSDTLESNIIPQIPCTDTDESVFKSTSSIRAPPKPTKYVKSPKLVAIDRNKRDSDSHRSVPTLSEAESVIYLGDKKSKKTPKKSEENESKRSKRDRKKQKKSKAVKTETGIQTSPDTEQQRYARSRFLRSDRPKSARPERRLLRLNNYLCFKPDSPELVDETLKVTKTEIDNTNEPTEPSEVSYNVEQFATTPSTKQDQIESQVDKKRSGKPLKKIRSKSCTREVTDSSIEQESTVKRSKSRPKKKLGKDFSSQTDLTELKQNKPTKGVQFSYEDLVNLNDIDRNPIKKKNSSSQTDLTEDKPISILKRTLTEPTIHLKKPTSGHKPKFVSIADSGIQTSFDRSEQPSKSREVNLFEPPPCIKITSESQTGDSLIGPLPHKIDGDSQTSLEFTGADFKSKKFEDMSQVTSTTSNMAARIDLHIKVSSNVQVDGNASESDTVKDEKFTEKNRKTEKGDQPSNLVREETLTVDNQKLTIRVISEENLCVSHTNDGEIDVKRNSTENLDIQQPVRYKPESVDESTKHLDIDELSVHSMSEGDNSVFTDGHVTPTEPELGAVGGTISPRKSHTDNQEEVDDIELIFSSDDKDFAQEDLVSFTEYEPWQEASGTGTPILVKFNKKSSSVDRDVDQTRQKLVKQDSGAQTDAEPKFQSMESNETYSSGYNKQATGEFSSKTPSLEKESSYEQEAISREESFDTFEQAVSSAIQRRWTKASILVETDISKCGITEEIKEEMLMGFPRRNTCPNPAPYR